MKNLSRAFRQALYNNERDYLGYADITLANNTTLSLTNSEIWSGGFSFEEAVSEDDVFTAVGSVIISSATLIINNIYETYTQYDFTDARVVLYLGMQLGETLEKFKIGTYLVDDATYNGATIKLSLLDYLTQFDRPYTASSLTYPASLNTILRNLCSVCGVTLDTLTFPHDDYVISTRPDDESVTCREVLSWVATLAGCFVKCSPNGHILLQWFDTTSLDEFATDLDGGTFNPWSSGTVYDGGTFNPWSEGDVYDGGDFTTETGVHYLTNLYSQNIGVDDVVITGVSITIKDDDQNTTQDLLEYSSGTSGYVIQLEENGFITKSNAQVIVNWLGTQLIGLRFRKLNINIASDPSIESGDVGVVVDRKQNIYRILITRSQFSIDNTQTVVCGASTPARNTASRFTAATKSYVEARKLLYQQRTAYDAALNELSNALDAKSGMYTTIETAQSGNIYYMHDKPLLADSKVVWKMNAEALGVTTNYNGSNPSATTWNFGVQINGTVVARILNTIGINADWINTGQLVVTKTVSGSQQEVFFVDVDTGTVRIVANSFSLSNGDTINSIAQAESKTMTKRLTNQYASSSTAASTAAKSTGSTPTNFELYTGAKVSVYFSNANTASNPTLNVNSTGAKSIYVRGSAITSKDYWTAGSVCEFVYNGSQWVMLAESQTETFNRLTAGGANEGIYLSGGHLYINASMINTGTLSANFIKGGVLKLGGSSNGNGQIEIYNSSNTKIGTWNNNGISLNNGKFAVDSSGNVTALSLTAYGSLLCYESYTIS